MDLEQLAAKAIDCGLRVHKAYGSGLLESAYEAMLAHCLASRGLHVAQQVPVDMRFEGVRIPHSFRIDLLVENQLVIEVKSTERASGVHAKQLLTYLRISDRPLGLLMNFGGETFREGLKRVANNYYAQIPPS